MATRLAGVKRPLLDFHGMTDALPSTAGGHKSEAEADIAEFAAKRSRLHHMMDSSRESAALPARAPAQNAFPIPKPLQQSQLAGHRIHQLLRVVRQIEGALLQHGGHRILNINLGMKHR